MVNEGAFASCGYTTGDWNTTNLGGQDFMAVGLNSSDGSELWRWQVRDLTRAWMLRAGTSALGIQRAFPGEMYLRDSLSVC